MKLKLAAKVSVLAMFMILFSSFITASYTTGANAPLASDPAPVESGRDIYNRACISCHGSNGRGETRRGKRKGAKDLTKSKISTAMGIKIITYGRGEMPSFKDSLSSDEIRLVNAYVRALR